MADIGKYCTRVVKLEQGHVVADDPTKKILL